MENGKMVTNNTTITNTKKVLTIALCAIFSLFLSIIFVNKTSAESTLPVDFIVATTNLRESNRYYNDSETIVWELATGAAT